MEWIRKRKFNRTIIAALLLTMTVWLLPAGLMVEKAEAAVQLDDPVIRDMSQMDAGQKVTWDCVWFGSYPQSEVVCETDIERISDLTGNAYAQNFPDGLAGGTLAMSLQAPVLLTDNVSFGYAGFYGTDAGLEKAAVLGGVTLINDEVNKVIN